MYVTLNNGNPDVVVSSLKDGFDGGVALLAHEGLTTPSPDEAPTRRMRVQPTVKRKRSGDGPRR